MLGDDTDVVLVLLIGLGKDMSAQGRIQHIVIVGGACGLQSGLDAGKTGVGNGTCRQTRVGVGVVGAVDSHILGGQIRFAVQSVDDTGVDVQIAGSVTPLVQTVVDDGCDY